MQNDINIGDLVRLNWNTLSHTMFPDVENGGTINAGSFFRQHGDKIGIVIKKRNYKSGERSYVSWYGDNIWEHMSLPTYVLKLATPESLEEDLKTVERLRDAIPIRR